jgi:Ser/Thr protein kinase RdoA (MazF antagonist)
MALDPPIYSTLGGASVAALIEAHWPLGKVASARLMLRGLNDVYEVPLADGARYLARLGGRRYRGPDNVTHEAALLTHLKAAGAPVAAPIALSAGALALPVAAAEGERMLMLSDFVDGIRPMMFRMIPGGTGYEDVPPRMAAMGASMGQLHAASASYQGPESRYTLDAAHLLHNPAAQIVSSAICNSELRARAEAIVARLDEALTAVAPSLTTLRCHGDTHSGNLLVTSEGDRLRATWFDFDDCGPGWQTYDLCIMFWAMLRHIRAAEPNDLTLIFWRALITGYRTMHPIAEADYAAIGLFVSIRHIWFLGEYCSRLEQWGTESFSRDWLAGELDLLESWKDLVAPAL